MALDSESPQLDLQRVGRPPNSRLPALLISAAAIFVAIALIKPWPAPSPTTHTDNHPIRPTTPQTAQPTALTGESGYFQQCFPTATWRLTAIQDHGATAVRTVWPASPSFYALVNDDPVDPVLVYGAAVEAIGFCAPGDAAARLASAASVSLWRRDARGVIVPVDGARVIDTLLASEGEVYFAPPTPLATNGEWPVGDYFFSIGQDRTGSSPTWMALQVLALPVEKPLRPTTSPDGTRGPHARVYLPSK